MTPDAIPAPNPRPKRAPVAARTVHTVHATHTGKNALHEAVRANRFRSVRRALLDKPGSVREADDRGDLPIHVAAASPRVGSSVLRLLLDTAASTAFLLNARGETAVHVAARLGNVVALTALVRNAHNALLCLDRAGDTPLMAAVRAGRSHAAGILCSAAPHVMLQPDAAGNLPLHVAVERYVAADASDASDAGSMAEGSMAEGSMAEGSDADARADIVTTLLRKMHWAAAMDQRVLRVGAGAGSLLYVAIVRGHADLARMVLELDPAAAADRAPDGQTMLHVAAWSGNAGVVRAVLDAADAHLCLARDCRGELALHCAAMNARDTAVVALLHAQPATAAALSSNGCSPLFLAAAFGNEGTVRVLLAAQPDMAGVACDGGFTPAYVAAYFGHHACLDALLAVAPDTAAGVACDGLNALHAAVATCWPQSVAVVLRRAPHLATSCTADGRTAVQLLLLQDDAGAVLRDDAQAAPVLRSLLRVAPHLATAGAMRLAAARGMVRCALHLASAAPQTALAGLDEAARARRVDVAMALVGLPGLAPRDVLECLAPHVDVPELGAVFVRAIATHVPSAPPTPASSPARATAV